MLCSYSWLSSLITPLVIAIVLPVTFATFWALKKRGEKKLVPGEHIKTRPPKALSGFFLGFGIVVLCGGIAGIIYCCITDGEHTSVTVVLAVSICIALFSSLGFFGYAYVRFNYVVADNEGVTAYRLFRKTLYYRYEEIGSFKDTIWMGMMGGLIGYDGNGKKIFAVEAVHIGSSAVAARLREHNVPERDSVP